MIRTLLAVALAASLPLFAAAQDTPAGDVGDVQVGEAYYAQFCATCHGGDAGGMGPTAEILTLQPTDLTTLSAGNGGVFPLERVVRQIDGRSLVVAHGAPMPLFGPFFDGEDVAIKAPSGQPMLVSRPIADLVAWLRTIQR